MRARSVNAARACAMFGADGARTPIVSCSGEFARDAWMRAVGYMRWLEGFLLYGGAEQ